MGEQLVALGKKGIDRYYDLRAWVISEWKKGNRVKASRINKISEKYRPVGCKLYPPISPPPKRGAALNGN